jgi:hypothetical protein
MIMNHVAHVFEEILGRFWLLNKLGLAKYLVINLVLFCIPLILLYFVLNGKLWAYKFSIAYAGFMAIQGIGHNVATIITGRYYDGFAGGFTGIGLIIIGFAIVYYLLSDIRTIQVKSFQ